MFSSTSGRSILGFRIEPRSPPVQVTTWTSTPSATYFAVLAAPLLDSSSGWAWTCIRRSMGPIILGWGGERPCSPICPSATARPAAPARPCRGAGRVLAAAALAWLAWVVLFHGRPEVHSPMVVPRRRRARRGRRASRGPPRAGRRAYCLLRASADDHSIVGRARPSLSPGVPRRPALIHGAHRAAGHHRRPVGCSAAGQTAPADPACELGPAPRLVDSVTCLTGPRRTPVRAHRPPTSTGAHRDPGQRDQTTIWLTQEALDKLQGELDRLARTRPRGDRGADQRRP